MRKHLDTLWDKHMIFKVIIATQIKHMIACPGKNTQTFMEILDKKYWLVFKYLTYMDT